MCAILSLYIINPVSFKRADINICFIRLHRLLIHPKKEIYKLTKEKFLTLFPSNKDFASLFLEEKA